MNKDYSKILLGYRDYNDDEKYGKDFLTLDSVVEWISKASVRETETTKEFFDFAEQEYGIDKIIQRMKELYPDFPYLDDPKYTPETEIKEAFDSRNIAMKASEFKEAKIPQSKE